MHKPMEILSLTPTNRTDSGSGVRQQTRPTSDGSSAKFERILEGERNKHESRKAREMSNPETAKEPGKPVKIPKDEKEMKTDEALAAGVTGNQQNEVVIILEGDKESVATQRVEDTAAPPVTTKEEKPEVPADTVDKQFKLVDEAENKAVKSETPQHEKQAGTVGQETNTIKPAAANADENTENKANAAGEQMARMPEIKTGDSQDKSSSNSNLSDKGYPGPLENENDKEPIEGQKETTYTQTADAVRSAVKEKSEPVTEQKAEPVINEIVPPLSEGIKPEQFKAAQQMTEAALNAAVKPENLFEQMIERVEIMKSEAINTMSIRLNPEYLGNVALEIAVDAAGLHVKINAEDVGVRGMINGQLTALIESLENKGIAVAEVEVIYTGINYGAFQDPRGESKQQSGGQHNSKQNETNAADAITYYTTLPDMMDYYLDTGVSSVEYSA